MTLTVLDTSACAAVMRHDADIERYLAARAPGELALVPPVVAEIEYGIRRLAENSSKRRLLEGERDRLLGAVRVLDWIPEASVDFGRLKAALERNGTPVDDMDVAIAAIALSHRADVLTANIVHFSRFSGLTVRHWRDAEP